MLAAPFLPLRTFNHKPQSSGLGLTFRSAYIFLDNVASTNETNAQAIQQGIARGLHP